MRSKLDDAAVSDRLAERPDWELTAEDRPWIRRRYRFRSFPDAIAFVQEVGRIAEESEHHPFIAIDYRVVTLRLTTWSAGGLTKLDFVTAAKFDGAYDAMQQPERR
ncbi:4a-hydroxytetrahydrobiopterin dehydratase [Paenibacillus filicis]|uniref:4a-hydroxytetrahydrobiopterin dehydratase n=1 Tax=Paenibacillus filicis TaxID=669464 RepID=A0ABU9DPA1_9BACL